MWEELCEKYFGELIAYGKGLCKNKELEEGLEVVDCAVVKIAEDIPKELIAEKLSIEDCGIVKCSDEQQDAVELICQDTGIVGADNDIGSIVDAALGEGREALDTKVINAADYVM